MKADVVGNAMKYIRGLVADGYTYPCAAINYKVRYPKEYEEVLERIGMWPSSEKELRILQRLNNF